MARIRIVLSTVHGVQVGTEYALAEDKPLTIGRTPDNDIQLLDTKVSRHHCRIENAEGGFRVVDLGSNNGTLVNERPVTDAPLVAGDVIAVGNTQFRVCEDRKPEGKDAERIPAVEEAIESSVHVGTATFVGPGAPMTDKAALVEAERVLGILCRAADTFPRIRNHAEIVERSLEFAMDLMNGDRGFMALAGAKDGALDVQAVRPHGVRPEQVSLSSTIVQRAMDTEMAILAVDAMDDRRFRNHMSVKMHRIRSVAYVPLKGSQRVLGVLGIDTANPSKKFTMTQLNRLCVLANHVAFAIENLSLLEAARRKELLESQLQIARDIQENFLPKHMGPIDGLEYAACCLPAMEVGGDFYDWLKLPDGRAMFAVGDVAGKGIPAALAMSRAMGNLRFLTAVHAGAAPAMRAMNESVCDSSAPGMFITLVCVLFDPKTRVAEICLGGHPPPALWKASTRSVQFLNSEKGMLLGLMRDWNYKAMSVPMEKGDVLFLYTDGITEAERVGEEFFGADRMKDCLRDCAALGAQGVLDSMVKAVDAFTGDRDRSDDTTGIVLKCV